ncbi:CaiB/BaiF CoA transferase family protein [Brevibacterium sp. VCM10]|uniref:CaiB/BaiF CoA transferase family protein n=1 Tax=Brevibacterium sp. VCM10 TaxID=1381751 RepID=UPI00046F63AD|nr:CaiB/BaiF CoA-transferase family protein [Brevibacterium sp. VCM10]
MAAKQSRKGPLVGIRVLELGGVGPGPFACMLLADLGAEVVRIDRPPAGYDGGAPVESRFNLLQRSRRSLGLDLKADGAKDIVLRLARESDVVIEGFRPGVAERLGLGPKACMAENPRLVYGRMTGWGQDGPLARQPGHDINYVSLSGVLGAIGEAGGPPVIPLNLGGDFGGGSLYLVMGVLSALIECRTSGYGQVVDAAMIDGSSSLMTLFHGLTASGYWQDQRGVNRLDSGAPWYSVYETSDGQWMSIGASETRFWRKACTVLGLVPEDMPDQHDQSRWPELKAKLAARFGEKTREEWTQLAEKADACISPVMSLGEVSRHPHLQARNTFVEVGDIEQPAPAPKFSRTPGAIQNSPPTIGADTLAVLTEWGFELEEVQAYRKRGAIFESSG